MARIGVDLDGVCYGFTDSLRQYMVDHKGYDPKDLPDSTGWDFHIVDWGWTTEQFMEHFAAGVDAGVVFLHGEPEEGAVKYINQLREDGHTIHIITHRSVGAKSVQNTGEWLAREGIKFDSLTFSGDKTIVKTDFFIEDNLDNYNALLDVGTDAVLYDRPWNQKDGVARRVAGWAEFYEYVSFNTRSKD